MSAWIKMIPENEATGILKDMHARAMTPHGTVDNVMKVHSLRPHTMHGHVTLYKSVLHHPRYHAAAVVPGSDCLIYQYKK